MNRFIFYFLLFSLGVSACSSNKNTPEYVAQKYLEAVKEKNWEEMKKYVVKDCHDKIDMMKILGTQFGISEIKDIKCTVDNNHSTCTYCCSSSDINCLDLVNEDNKWKISLRKMISCRDRILTDSLTSKDSINIESAHSKKLPADFKYLPEMYGDSYFPKFLVDKVRSAIQKVAKYIEEGNHNINEIQAELDKMTIAINNMQEEFYENNSEIETGARESIANTVERMLKYFEIDIDTEEAIRKRDW